MADAVTSGRGASEGVGEEVAVGVGVIVFVVCGCVPEGEALGNGVTVAVGSGVACKGVTVAVGRGPAGMVGLGSGLISSSGDWAGAFTAANKARNAIVALRKFHIPGVSSGEDVLDVNRVLLAP